jgi:ribosomal protein S21
MINAQVTLKRNADQKLELDKALKRLKHKLVLEGTMDTVRSKRQFETPKERRERKRRETFNRNKILGLRN